MKTLSIKQPWASLIAHGIKDIENRSWRTHYRGKIYIHATASNVSLYEALNQKQIDYTNAIWNADFYPKRPISAIIGEVDIVDCVINHKSIWAEKSPYCPITGLEFFADIPDENGNIIATYGGPFDSYSVPIPDEDFPNEFFRRRFCHDRGCWREDETISKKTNIPKDRKPIYNWVLKNAILYDEPILNVKGKLSLWEFEKPEIK